MLQFGSKMRKKNYPKKKGHDTSVSIFFIVEFAHDELKLGAVYILEIQNTQSYVYMNFEGKFAFLQWRPSIPGATSVSFMRNTIS